MSQYVVTYTPEAGADTLSLSVSLGNDEQGRQFASRTARRCHAVSLFGMDDEGLTLPIAEWVNGVLQRRNGKAPVTIEGEVETEDEVSDEDESDIEISSADEAHHFTGRCMKCKTSREFVGRVKELSNGSKAAMGHCPVCGTTITRMVSRTTPVDEWEDEDFPHEHEHPDTDESAPEIQPTDAEDYDEAEQQEAEKAIAEAIAESVPEGTPVAEVAEATAVAAVEFSNAADEVEQPKPAKKAPAKKAAAKKQTPAKRNGKTANQRAAANPSKGICPNCDAEVDIIERGGLRIFTVHPDAKRGTDRCAFSTTVVPGEVD